MALFNQRSIYVDMGDAKSVDYVDWSNNIVNETVFCLIILLRH